MASDPAAGPSLALGLAAIITSITGLVSAVVAAVVALRDRSGRDDSREDVVAMLVRRVLDEEAHHHDQP